MRIDEQLLVKAMTKQMVVELRMKEGGETIELTKEYEEAQGAVDTIKELLQGNGQRVLRDDQLKAQALQMLIAVSGRTPGEIASILTTRPEKQAHTVVAQEKQRSRYHKIEARKPRTEKGGVAGSPWEKCKSDFVYFCEYGLEIVYRPGLNINYPDGGYGAFVLNGHQIRIVAVLIDDWLAGKPIRAIILKARQLGITTALLAFWLWLMIQTPNLVAFFMIDKDQHMYEKRDMILNWIEKLSEKFPDAPTLSAKGGKRIVLSNKAKFLFESAHSPNPGTSEMCHIIHLSEKPKWPKGKAALVDKSLLPGQPSSKGTFLVDESTAMGIEDFHKKWHRVMGGLETGRTKTRPLFLPWYLSPEYSELVTHEDCDKNGKFVYLNEDREVCESDEFGDINLTEEAYAEKYKLTEAQILWRRNSIKNDYKGVRGDWDQEYPTTPAHAWASFGSLFFGSQCALEAERQTQEPIITGYIVDLDGNNDPARLFSWPHYRPGVSADRNGPLHIFERPKKGAKYFLGGDLAEGKQVQLGKKLETDFSTINVDDEYGITVATYRARTKPEDMAIIVLLIAILFNNAQVNVERNSVGEACWAMFKQSGYNNVYLRDGTGPYDDRAWNKTMPSNRKTMLLELRHHLRRNPQAVVCRRFAHEVGVFITNKDGKPEAMAGEHDDLVLAKMHSWHMIYDIKGIRVEVEKEEEEPPHELEFFSVLEANGVNLEEWIDASGY